MFFISASPKTIYKGLRFAIVPGDPERVEKIAALMDKPVAGIHREFTSWRGAGWQSGDRLLYRYRRPVDVYR
jgi:uridine phosphorylase